LRASFAIALSDAEYYRFRAVTSVILYRPAAASRIRARQARVPLAQAPLERVTLAEARLEQVLQVAPRA
jgi:hypothetical protein